MEGPSISLTVILRLLGHAFPATAETGHFACADTSAFGGVTLELLWNRR